MSKRMKTVRLDAGSGAPVMAAAQPWEKELRRLDTPTKSYKDTKEYSVIQLRNGFTALLISDVKHLMDASPLDLELPLSDHEDLDQEHDGSTTDGSDDVEMEESSGEDSDGGCKTEEKLGACAICIGVGSFSDPEEIPGLAHFLEHMLFMGSTKYPRENHFDAFIKRKGGSDNAATECEYTTFYFECHDTALYQAMDLFSQFFISPLMQREAMTRERQAIESEFQMSLPSDTCRKEQLISSMADPANPGGKFVWGNLKTLKEGVTDDRLYERTHQFWGENYTASRMTLAVQARLPLQLLEKWVVQHFSSIPDRKIPHPLYSPLEKPFIDDKFMRIYYVESVKDVCELELRWVLPPLVGKWRSKPGEYLSHLIGHEGRGSLLSYLRKKLWALEAVAGHGDDGLSFNSVYTVFLLSVSLTEEGYKNLDSILHSTFGYLDMLRLSIPNQRIFDELQAIQEMKFRYAEESSPVDLVEALCEAMQFYPPEQYISGGELYFDYDQELISNLLALLTPSNCNVIISNRNIANEKNLDQVEPWFSTKYTSEPIPAELLESLKTVTNYPEFHLPLPNDYIPSDLSLLAASQNPKYPEKVKCDEVLEVFYRQDTKFKLPMAHVLVSIVTNAIYETPSKAALADLYVLALKQILVEETYPASMVSLYYNVGISEHGLSFGVSGFNEKVHLLLDTILKHMIEFERHLTQEMFTALKVVLKRDYCNTCLKPSNMCREIRMSILLDTGWTTVEKYNAVAGLQLADLREFSSTFYKKAFLQCLVQGNISEGDAVRLCDDIVLRLGVEPAEENVRKAQIRVGCLPNEAHLHARVHTFNPSDKNCVTTDYFQLGPGTIRESCIIELLLMLMEEPLFDQLRTQEQLGYEVSSSLRDTHGILGFSVTVVSQACHTTVDHVETRIRAFLDRFLLKLKSMPQREFNESIESLVKLKKCADENLKEEVKRNWEEIKSFEYCFDRLEKEIAFLTGPITRKDLVKLFTRLVVKEKRERRLLTVQVVSGDEGALSKDEDITKGIIPDQIQFSYGEPPVKGTPHAEYIKDVSSYNKSLKLYPPHKLL